MGGQRGPCGGSSHVGAGAMWGLEPCGGSSHVGAAGVACLQHLVHAHRLLHTGEKAWGGGGGGGRTWLPPRRPRDRAPRISGRPGSGRPRPPPGSPSRWSACAGRAARRRGVAMVGLARMRRGARRGARCAARCGARAARRLKPRRFMTTASMRSPTVKAVVSTTRHIDGRQTPHLGLGTSRAVESSSRSRLRPVSVW